MGSIPEVSIISGANRDYKIQSMHRMFEENLNSTCYGNKPAIISIDLIGGDRRTTYNQLNFTANQIAVMLIEQINKRKMKPNPDGDWIIAVCMLPSDELIITLLAILKTGAAYLPIDPTFTSNRIQHILQETKPAFVIWDKNAIDLSVFGCTATLSFAECQTLSQSLDYDGADIADDRMLSSTTGCRLALVLYTSGSTGLPKGVRLPHSAVMNRLQWQWETFPYSPTETTGVFKTALTFSDSTSEIWSPLLNGKSVLVIPKYVTRDPSQLVFVLEKYEIERLVLVPTLLKSLLIYLSFRQDPTLLNKLKLWICSGETLPASLAMEFYDYFPENTYSLCNFYGSAEVMADVLYFICEGKKQLRNVNRVPIGGHPIFNTKIYILNSEKKPVRIGAVGELFVSGSNLAQGYVNDRHTDRFIENSMAVDPKYSRLYRSGDYASVRKDGIIHYEGRTDSQVKIRGHRIDLTEIEKHLIAIPEVKGGIVMCHHAEQMDQTIIAFTVIRSLSLVHKLEIEKILRNNLPEYMIPQVIIVDQLPLLVTGKIDRQSLLKMYENANNDDDPEVFIDHNFSEVFPNELQKAKLLFETISEVIGRSIRTPISLKSNFYTLGGNSLNSIYTLAKLRDKGYFIEITNFILAKNLKEIIAHMTETKSSRTSSTDIMFNKTEANLVALPLAMEHKKEAIHIISISFVGSSACVRNSRSLNVHYNDYVRLLEEIWEPLVKKGYSFIIKDNSNRIIGVCLNFDANEKPYKPVVGPLTIIFEFLDFVEIPTKNCLPKDRTILYSFMMGTLDCLSAQENIVAITFMENEVICVAKERNCCGILTTNTNALTQQLAYSVFGYQTMLDYQLNQFVSDGKKPFGTVPDSYRAIVQWKNL